MNLKEKIAVMQAFDEGGVIEYSEKGKNHWVLTEYPLWDWNNCDYRVKPMSTKIPYSSIEEILQDQKEHGPYIVLSDDVVATPISVTKFIDEIDVYCVTSEIMKIKASDLIDCCWQDGKGCYVLKSN